MNWYKKIEYKIAFPSRSRLSDDDILAIKDLVEQGYPIRDISNLSGVPVNNIYSFIKSRKWKYKSRKRTKDDIMKRDREIADLYLLPPLGQGLSASHVAKKVHVTNQEIPMALSRLGLSNHLRGLKDSVNTPLAVDTRKKQYGDPSYMEKRRLQMKDPSYRKDISNRFKKYWENMPGGFWGWISKFPIEKQNEILRAMGRNLTERGSSI